MTGPTQSTTQDQLLALQALFNTEIPLTKHLKLHVANYDGKVLKLNAPLAENVNHSGTAFAGSLNALLTLAGWGMVWLVLQECALQQGETVIQDGSCNYLRPVTTDFVATCEKPVHNQLKRFEKTLRERGKARLELCAEIMEGNMLVVSFRGRYVVHLR